MSGGGGSPAARRVISGRAVWVVSAVVALCSAAGCAPRPGDPVDVEEIPQPDLTDMESQVEARLVETRAAVVATPRSADAWGRFGMVLHAHELWEEALAAYRQAERLDLDNPRWPYFMADVLSVVGTDLEAAARAFRRAMAIEPDYAPAHMRLGKVLLADDRPAEAARELERALALEPTLQPARVTLAQIRLAEGELESAAAMLEEILRAEPRHAQALSTLGQTYMRLGRREEARAIAERARSAAIYNLFEDPLMSEVVAEGLSSVLIWERAKAFLDNGDYRQAALGLGRVVELRPANADAHQQLGVAYGNLGDLERSRRHLERSVELAPDRVDSLIQLVTVALDQRDATAATDLLGRILELAPDDPDARWLLGRAQLMGGDLPAGIGTFERAAVESGEVPVWARNEWGSALAQTGRADEALQQFKAALRDDPEDAQAHFYSGLVLEGLGRVDEAIGHYCRSLEARPNPPARERLNALGRNCS